VVLFAGRVVEQGETSEVFSQPLHPYTQQLLASIPGRRGKTGGNACRPPVAENSSTRQGCRYVVRCHMAEDPCWATEPDLSEVEGGRRVRCPFALPGRPGSRADG
jgi:oligopeptide/dipeptide ABC transporter ATP-binding protein